MTKIERKYARQKPHGQGYKEWNSYSSYQERRDGDIRGGRSSYPRGKRLTFDQFARRIDLGMLED